MMLTFLELAYMVDATQHDGVGWVGNDVRTFLELAHVTAQTLRKLI